MDFKLELAAVPVSDVDRAKAFYTEQAGFDADHDHQVNEEIPLRPADAARRGVGVSEISRLPWGDFVFFQDPDGNGWSVQAIPKR